MAHDTTNAVDSEILFAAALGVTLARMRAELDDAAVKRIMTFTLDRYGIVPECNGGLYIRTMPAARLKAGATVAEVFPDAPPPAPKPVAAHDTPPLGRVPLHSAVCPICGKAAVGDIGLNSHMHKVHGVTLKEHRRQLALNGQPS